MYVLSLVWNDQLTDLGKKVVWFPIKESDTGYVDFLYIYMLTVKTESLKCSLQLHTSIIYITN